MAAEHRQQLEPIPALAWNQRAPLSRLSRRQQRRALWLLIGGLAVFGGAQLPELQTMNSHGASILDFEFVRTTARANQILKDWGAEGRSAARTSLWLDYPFLVSYALLYSLACGALADRAKGAGKARWATLGVVLSWASLGAGLFDALENAALLRILAGHPEQPYPALASASAAGKFVLSAAALLYLAVFGLLSLRLRS
jgi:hypothetical protein